MIKQTNYVWHWNCRRKIDPRLEIATTNKQETIMRMKLRNPYGSTLTQATVRKIQTMISNLQLNACTKWMETAYFIDFRNLRQYEIPVMVKIVLHPWKLWCEIFCGTEVIGVITQLLWIDVVNTTIYQRTLLRSGKPATGNWTCLSIPDFINGQKLIINTAEGTLRFSY